MKSSFTGKKIATKIAKSGTTVSAPLGKNYPSRMRPTGGGRNTHDPRMH